MPVKRAMTLTDADIQDTLRHIRSFSRQRRRDELLILLTCYAGLRIGEACSLHFIDFMDARGNVKDELFVSGRGAKYGKARTVPLRQEIVYSLQSYLDELRSIGILPFGNRPIFRTRDGAQLSSTTARTQVWSIYRAVGLQGCSSHSGRRTFATRAVKALPMIGGSIIDVSILLGHADSQTTLIYVEPSKRIKDFVASL